MLWKILTIEVKKMVSQFTQVTQNTQPSQTTQLSQPTQLSQLSQLLQLSQLSQQWRIESLPLRREFFNEAKPH